MEATPDPTPAEIAECSAEIQAGWTDHERARRATRCARVEWLPPEFVGVDDSGETTW